jgi:hypothetical protein
MHFLRANAAMCKFVGYSEGELLARGQCLTSRIRMTAFQMEKRYIRKDGSVVWARPTVNVVRDEFGRPLRNIAVVLDMTEREEKEHLLMREINHRGKNMLSAVDAIGHRHQKSGRFRRALLRAYPGAFNQSGPTDAQ